MVRVNGPLVEVDGLTGVAMSELVELGAHRLPGEVVAIGDDGRRCRPTSTPAVCAPVTAARPCGARCRPGSGRACSAASSTDCCGRCAGAAPGWTRAPGRPDRTRRRRRSPARRPRQGPASAPAPCSARSHVPAGGAPRAGPARRRRPVAVLLAPGRSAATDAVAGSSPARGARWRRPGRCAGRGRSASGSTPDRRC